MKKLLLIIGTVISFNYAHAAASSEQNHDIDFIAAGNHDTQTALALSQMIQTIPGNTACTYQIGFASISTIQVLGCLIVNKDPHVHIPDGIAEVIANRASLLHRMRKAIQVFNRNTTKRISCVPDFLMARRIINDLSSADYDFTFFDASRLGVRTYFYTNEKLAWIGGKRMHEVQADRQCYIFKNDRICHFLPKTGATPIDQKRNACLQAKNFALAVSIDGATVAQYFFEKAAYIPPSSSRKHIMSRISTNASKDTDPEESHRFKKNRRD